MKIFANLGIHFFLHFFSLILLEGCFLKKFSLARNNKIICHFFNLFKTSVSAKLILTQILSNFWGRGHLVLPKYFLYLSSHCEKLDITSKLLNENNFQTIYYSSIKINRCYLLIRTYGLSSMECTKHFPLSKMFAQNYFSFHDRLQSPSTQ